VIAGPIYSALQLGEQYLVIRGVNDADEFGSALLAFEAVTLEPAAVYGRNGGPIECQSSGAPGTLDEFDTG